MTEFIDRPESRYLDILHIGIQAILSLKSPNGRYDKYEDGVEDNKRVVLNQ